MKLPKSKSKIELPKLEMPKPVADVYRELRGQHLLPLVVLLIASLIAIPFLLGESSDAQSPAAQTATATPSSTPSRSTGSSLTASIWHPGLRDYKKRLSFRHPTDPFANGYTASESGSDIAESGSASEPPPPETPEATETTESTVSPPSEMQDKAAQKGPAEGNGPDAIDVKVTAIQADGKTPNGSVRYKQPQLTKLPSKSVPALTYLGPGKNGTTAIMLVSPDVSALAGNSKCVVPAEPCQLLALELQAPETLVIGPNQATYQIELLKIGGLSDPPAPRPNTSASPAAKIAVGQAKVARLLGPPRLSRHR